MPFTLTLLEVTGSISDFWILYSCWNILIYSYLILYRIGERLWKINLISDIVWVWEFLCAMPIQINSYYIIQRCNSRGFINRTLLDCGDASTRYIHKKYITLNALNLDENKNLPFDFAIKMNRSPLFSQIFIFFLGHDTGDVEIIIWTKQKLKIRKLCVISQLLGNHDSMNIRISWQYDTSRFKYI